LVRVERAGGIDGLSSSPFDGLGGVGNHVEICDLAFHSSRVRSAAGAPADSPSARASRIHAPTEKPATLPRSASRSESTETREVFAAATAGRVVASLSASCAATRGKSEMYSRATSTTSYMTGASHCGAAASRSDQTRASAAAV
jgi:hypothetical protein